MKAPIVAAVAVVLGVAACTGPVPLTSPAPAGTRPVVKPTTTAKKPTPTATRKTTPKPTPAVAAHPTIPVIDWTYTSKPTRAYPYGTPRFTRDRDLLTCTMRVIDPAKGHVLPDPRCTPGAHTSTTRGTLCSPTFRTGPHRPPTRTTNAWERTIAAAYHATPTGTTEADHLIPLTLGGSNAVANLWPQPNRPEATSTTNPKDTIEVRLRAEVCAGHVALDVAQRAIAKDWVALATRPGSETLAAAAIRTDKERP